MTTDNKTLADVQPGGRVRLGDQRSDLVPGIVRCAKCSFQLHRTNLYLQSGTVGAGDSKTEPCPNGCGPLWPVTWETWSREGWAEAERLHLENAALSAQPSLGGQDALVTDAMVYAAEEAYANSKPDNLHESFRVAIAAALAARQPVKGLSWADYWMERGQPDAAHDFDAFSRAEAWALQRFPDASQPVGLPLTLCRDSYPPLVAHSSSYGGVWTSDWCLVVDLNGSTCSARYQVSDFDKRSMDANGGVPNAVQNDPWRVPGFGHVVAWAKASDVVAHISRSTDAAPPAQVVDLDAVRALLQRRIEQWRSHLPADPGAPGTREIETKGEHDYNNDVRIYREGIAVMEEVLSKIDGQAVGK
ncbi:hypothetical protein [Stenotrophomonas maltophilia]|uniref:hypothetical protein n=1 Tax=Stenotrophomonas maltophilia TaxID=40324 RepID=UPI000B41D44F|nr:hypothetical protein [Stenotrophomonas maltophilia]OWB46494.1 hypothetical protein B7H27_10175 [Stenotrophomonas maltophilia]